MGSTACVVVLLAVLIGALFVLRARAKAADALEAEKKYVLDKAQAAYQSALNGLKADPANPDKKQRALELGRMYATLSREQGKVTIFDEMALSNDISAATAGASVAANVAAKSTTSVEDRLNTLEALQRKGLVSADEYAERRKQLLAEI